MSCTTGHKAVHKDFTSTIFGIISLRAAITHRDNPLTSTTRSAVPGKHSDSCENIIFAPETDFIWFTVLPPRPIRVPAMYCGHSSFTMKLSSASRLETTTTQNITLIDKAGINKNRGAKCSHLSSDCRLAPHPPETACATLPPHS